MNPLTKADLDKAARAGCQTPGCDHKNHEQKIFLHSRCHPAAGVEAMYKEGAGIVVLKCRTCRALITQIKVAE